MPDVVIKQDLKKIKKNIVSMLVIFVLFSILIILACRYLYGLLNFIVVVASISGAATSFILAMLDLIALPRLMKLDHPVVLLTKENIQFPYSPISLSGSKSSRLYAIPWTEVVEAGLFKQGSDRYITITLFHTERFLNGLEGEDKRTAKYFTKLCGTPAAFSVSTAEKTPEEIKKEINYYHAALLDAANR